MAAWRWPWHRLASPTSGMWCRREISDLLPSRSPSLPAKMQAAAKHLLSSGPAFHRHILRLRQLSGAASGSPFVGWYQPCSFWITRFLSLVGSARSNRPDSGVDILSGRTAYRRQRQRPAAKPHQPAMKQHLYLVLEDHHEPGFAIHKLDIDDDLDAHSGSRRRVHEPPVVRVGRPIIRQKMQFAALGSSIVATGICPVKDSTLCAGVTVIYDTQTAQLTISDLLPTNLSFGYNSAVAVRNKLYLLESHSRRFKPDVICFEGGLHCLKMAGPGDDVKLQADCKENNKHWKWQSLPNSSRFSWSWNTFPPQLPFDAHRIIAHAVHPRGGTIFVSATEGWQVGQGTFSYGIRSGKWTHRGDWVLPFKGPAHYDPELDAWLGLNLTCDNDVGHKTSGYLCASRVTSANASSQFLQRKVSIDKFFSQDLDHCRVNVQLLYIGKCNEYCLAEHLRLVDNYVLRLTMFRVTYGKDGELMTLAQRPARSYELPSYDEDFEAQAYWM